MEAKVKTGCEEVPQVEELVRQCLDFLQEKTGAQRKDIVGALGPGRVNLIGEHTDYNDGFVLPMAIPLVTVVVGHRTTSGRCRIWTLNSPKEGGENNLNLLDLPLPSEQNPLQKGFPAWGNYVRGVLANFSPGPILPFDAVVFSSVPLGGGLSSSASLEVAFYTFLEELTGHRAASPLAKALSCQKAEHEFAGVPCGLMDQAVCVLGQQGKALLLDCRSQEAVQVPLVQPGSSMSAVVLVTNSNVRHELSSGEYALRRTQCHQAAAALGVASLRDASMEMLEAHQQKMEEVKFRRAKHVVTEIRRTQEAVKALQKGDLTTFGHLMLKSHQSLKDDFEVSCAELDQLVEAAMEAKGVYGSRMTGGGFGGCTVTLVESSYVEDCVKHMRAKYQGSPTFYVCSASNGAHPLAV